MVGNEAIARGAFEAGVKVSAAYPGTPSTEISEYLSTYDGIYTEWSVNEKVAYEVALGAAISGVRSIVSMKCVGLNVAADPMFTSAYTGILGGMVIVVADDPGMHSSQNEQDTRLLAKAANIPVLEPADAQEAKEYTKIAFDISEKYDTPVMIRMTTRTSHSRSVVLLEEQVKIDNKEYKKNVEKNVMLPVYARKSHRKSIRNIAVLSNMLLSYGLNQCEINNEDIGIITSGICYEYVKEVFPDASVLKLGMVYPLNKEQILDFADRVQNVYVIEELEPFIEEMVRSIGIKVPYKTAEHRAGEYSINLIKQIIQDIDIEEDKLNNKKSPTFCKGCPHHEVFTIIHELGLNVTGDIGCYTLGALLPYEGMDITVCMGASISMLHGIEKAKGKDYIKNWVATIGDSTFFHTGINALINMYYNQSWGTVLILDNSTTAMTGHQDHPSSGYTLKGDKVEPVDISSLCRAIGIKNVHTVFAYNREILRNTILTECQREDLSVIIIKGACIFHRKKV